MAYARIVSRSTLCQKRPLLLAKVRVEETVAVLSGTCRLRPVAPMARLDVRSDPCTTMINTVVNSIVRYYLNLHLHSRYPHQNIFRPKYLKNRSNLWDQ
jgi:hypothetical protein